MPTPSVAEFDWVTAAVDTVVEDAACNLLDYIQWLPPQLAFRRDPSKAKLIRLGNQWGGKTTVALAEVIDHCLGAHPFYRVPPPPVEWWIVCESWKQSVAIQAKLHALLPKEQLDDRTRYDEINGFSPTKNPVVLFANGSKIRIFTTNQDARAMASGTIDGVLIDELTTPRIFGELRKRVARRNGKILLSLTPINRPADWLAEIAVQVEDAALLPHGKVRDHHYPLRAEYLIPAGSSRPMRLPDGTPMDQAWIDKFRAETLASEQPVACDGEWEMRVVGRVFAAFDPRTHEIKALPRGVGRLKIALGFDHGDGAHFSQVAVLVAIDDSGPHPRIWVLDEYVSTGTTTPDMDAASILQLLSRNDIAWHELDMVFGDRLYPGQRGGTSKKSNIDLMTALARELGITNWNRLAPQIKTVKRGEGHGRGSLDHGLRFLHQAMVRPGHFHVMNHCAVGIESMMKWDYRPTSEWKHWIDGLRYALDAYIFARPRSEQAVALRFA